MNLNLIIFIGIVAVIGIILAISLARKNKHEGYSDISGNWNMTLYQSAPTEMTVQGTATISKTGSGTLSAQGHSLDIDIDAKNKTITIVDESGNSKKIPITILEDNMIVFSDGENNSRFTLSR